MIKVAVIDDYQNIFQQIVDTEKHKDKFSFKIFNEPFIDEKEAAVELEDFEALFVMRERTPITKTLIQNLPKLKYIMTSGMRNKAIDLKVLPDLIASDRLSFGSADRLFEMLGVRPGAVSPFTLINDLDHKVQLVLDAGLANQSSLFAHPLVNDMTLEVSGAGLMRFFAHTGHKPKLLAF